jgi:hypothetical protein
MQREELFPDFFFSQNSRHLVCGELTDSGRAEARKFFPFLSQREVERIKDPRSLLTVRLLVGSIQQRLDAASRQRVNVAWRAS